MKRMKKLLACLLIVAFLMPIWPTETVSALEIDDYMEEVLENYDQYLEASDNSYWLTNDSRYHYDILAEKFKKVNFSQKLDMKAAYEAIGEKLTVDDCVKYLGTIINMVDSGMNANIQAQVQYDSTKGGMDYLKKAGTIVGDAVGIQNAVGLAKSIQEALGLASDTLDLLISSEESAWNFVATAQKYVTYKDFLTVINEYASYHQMREAAGLLLGLMECQLGYIMDSAYEQMRDTGSYMLKGTSNLIEEGLGDWIKENKEAIAEKWKWGAYLSVDEAWVMAKQVNVLWKAFQTGVNIGALAGDIVIGDVLRYLKEVMLLEDMSAAIMKGIEENDPADASGDLDKYETVKVAVPLLEALCATRVRGEYCANMIAQCNDTLFGIVVNNDDEMNEILEKDLEQISDLYQMLSEIFIVDDYTISVIWHNIEEITKMKNGKTFCEAQFTYPEVFLPGETDADDTINAYMKQVTDKDREEHLSYFGWEGPDTEWESAFLPGSANTFSVSYGGTNRMDQQVISFEGIMTQYYAGATHPLYTSRMFNFDAKTGELLKLSAMIESDAAFQQLCSLAGQYVDPEKADKENVREGAVSMLQKYALDDEYYYWYFTAEGLCFSYPPYSIASYSMGFIDSVIPYSQLTGIIKADYLPTTTRSEKGTDVHGEVVKELNITKVNNIYSCDGPGDGSYTLAFTSDEIVYDVTVYEGNGATDDYSYVYLKWPLITLSTLSPNSVILVECGASEDTKKPNLVVKWTDGTGRERCSMFGADRNGNLLEIMVD